MEIRGCLYFIFINCVLIQYLETKTISLNELIAAESQTEQATKRSSGHKGPRAKVSMNDLSSTESQNEEVPEKTLLRKIPGLFKRLSLFKHLAPNGKIRKFSLDNSILGEKLSPLKYRKIFQIRSPLKPKKLARRSRYKRKNQSVKREALGNDNLKQKYIPLLRSLGMLFDNLLNSDESNSYETKTKKYKRNRYYSNEQVEFPHYPRKPNARTVKTKSRKKTTTTSSSISTEVSTDATSLTIDENYDNSIRRPNKSVPLLLPRDTFGHQRDYNGTSKRSSTTFDGNSEGNIPRNHGDREHNSKYRKNTSHEGNDENDTHSPSRNDPSSIRHSRREESRTNSREVLIQTRVDTRDSQNGKTVNGTISENENTNDHLGKIQFEVRGDEIESEKFLRKPIRRLRGHTIQSKNSDDERVIPEPIHDKEVHEEGILGSTIDSTSHKRILDKSSQLATENEKIRRRNETVILIERNSLNGNYSKDSGKTPPVVLIFDGYSVTRDKNGENKVSGKTIHIRS